jgi:hypothetical protein
MDAVSAVPTDSLIKSELNSSINETYLFRASPSSGAYTASKKVLQVLPLGGLYFMCKSMRSQVRENITTSDY